MKKAFAKFFLLFTNYRSSMTLKEWICRIIHILPLPIIKFKIIFKVINRNKIKYSYLTVELKEIRSSIYLNDILGKYYNWDKLENSILKHGILNPLDVSICNELDPESSKMCRYCVSNGNHRITILKKLYPPNHKVKIKINNDVFNR